MWIDQNLLDDIIRRLVEVRGRPGKTVLLSEAVIHELCVVSKDVFLSQPNLLEIEAPIKVCGDIHGQYSDLLWLLEYGGFPPKARYLFIGNYVDYGMQGIETICLLLAYNIKCPKDFFILRGNHECANVGRRYGFYDECKRRYNVRAAASIACLLLLLLMGRFCVHGGLSPDLENLDQIRNIRRPTGVSDASLLCHLLWSDPCRDVKGWGMNDRGVSCTFGVEKIEEFLMKLDLDLICRSQKVVEGGYEFFADKKMVTVFSAPNFRGKTGNAGAVSPSIA